MYTVVIITVIITAGKQNVSCDFEDTFICGYTTSTISSLSWQRVSRKTLGISSSTPDKNGTLLHVCTTCTGMGNQGFIFPWQIKTSSVWNVNGTAISAGSCESETHFHSPIWCLYFLIGELQILYQFLKCDCEAYAQYWYDILSVCSSVCLSVCQTRVLWQNKISVCKYMNTIR